MKKILLALSIVTIATACKKNSGGSTPAPSCMVTASALTGTYKVTVVKYKASSTTAESDISSSIPACKKDDLYKLNVTGSYAVVDEGVSCGLPPGPGSIEGWALESNNSILKLAGESYTIEKFTCTDLVVSQADLAVAGDKTTTTFTKQ